MFTAIQSIAGFVARSFLHIWPYLLVTVPLAVAVQLSGVSKHIRRAFTGHPVTAIFLATLVGAFSPFCSCGVIPVVAALLLSGVPLGPVMSFWIASPLMDPEIFFLSASVLGWKLAIWRLAASLGLSLAAGFITHGAQRRGWLGADPLRIGGSLEKSRIEAALARAFAGIRGFAVRGKTAVLALAGRLRTSSAAVLPYPLVTQTACCETLTPATPVACCQSPIPIPSGASPENSRRLPPGRPGFSSEGLPALSPTAGAGCGCAARALPSPSPESSTRKEAPCDSSPASARRSSFAARLGAETWSATAMVVKFMALAFFLEALITLFVPSAWIGRLLGARNPWAIIMAAALGVPVYTSNLSALPLMGGLLAQGMNPAAALAFLISGPTTTLPAMAAVRGLVSRRVFWLYVSFALFGGIAAGYAYELVSLL